MGCPITLISGFQTAGKATLLRRLLENADGLKVGVLLNDLAGLDVSEALFAKEIGIKHDVVELQNGCCACCIAPDELLQGIAALMKRSAERSATWDHIVVELSGGAEPRKVRDTFRNALVSEPSILAGSNLHTLVAVVDASTFVAEIEKRNRLQERPDLVCEQTSSLGDSNRQVCDLLCEQIECADILVLDRVELVKSQHEVALVKQAVSSLNATAEVYTNQHQRVDLIDMLSVTAGGGVANLSEYMEHRRAVDVVTSSNHFCITTHDARQHANGHPKACCGIETAEDASADLAGGALVASFCYQRRVPFHPFRLRDVIRELPVRLDKLALSDAVNLDGQADGGSPMRRLIRSKGFVWLSNSHTQMFHWTHAGRHFEIKQHSPWWATHPRSQWATNEREAVEIQKDFEGEMGDRRQELIFVGINMDVIAMTKLLDECLLTTTEMADYRKRIREEPVAKTRA